MAKYTSSNTERWLVACSLARSLASTLAQEMCKQILVKSLTFFFAFLINFHVFFAAAVLLPREDAKAARTPPLNVCALWSIVKWSS